MRDRDSTQKERLVNAALIDLHVRAGQEGPLDLTTLLQSASTSGLDGVLVVGEGVAPRLTAASEGEQPPVQVYCAVELDSELGRLVCVPGVIDTWFTEGGWNELPKGDNGFEGAALIDAFNQRGGTVFVAQPFDRDLSHDCREDAFVGHEGLSAVVVTSSPRHTTSNERAAAAAITAKLPGAGGSASPPGGPRFGSVATLFPKAPLNQSGLISGLKSGRFWPVEITGTARRKVAEAKPRVVAEPRERAAAQPTKPDVKLKKRGRKSKEDNRGNELNLVRATRPVNNPYDSRQPDLDPIARLYGLHDRRDQRHAGRSDVELDRVDGNRARGPDANVMRPADFRELRAERQHVNLLLQTIDTQRQLNRESIALRFAIASVGGDTTNEDFDFDALEPEQGKRSGGHKKRGHQRRRWR